MSHLSNRSSKRHLHPAGAPVAPPRLYGRRIMMRPLVAQDFESWSDVRLRNADWLKVWEPRRSDFIADPAKDREAFERRCFARDRERQNGTAYTLGLFFNSLLIGEVNINNVVRGAMQMGTIGYWIDQKHAGNGYVAEGVVAITKFAFEELNLHRLEICIIPRNSNSKRVVEKLGLRLEGLAEKFLEINGVWEDHLRYAITSEEWHERREAFNQEWLAAKK